MDGNRDDQFPAASVVRGDSGEKDALAAAVDASPDGFGVVEQVSAGSGGTDYVWTHANPALLRLVGERNLVGRSVLGDKADGGAGRAFFELLACASATDTPQKQLLAMAGGYRRVFVQGCAFAPDLGVARILLVTVTNFADARLTDPLRVALDHCQDAIALFDAEGRLVDATDRLKQLFPEIAELLIPGAALETLLERYFSEASSDEAAAASAWAARRLARHRRNGGEATFCTPAGRWLRNREWRTPDGGVISIFTDVTDFKEQEKQLRASEASALSAKQEAEKASRAKSDFLAHMSHELRTPLNAIIGFAELLELETLGPLGNRRYVSYARDILDSGRRLLELVDDALNLAQIDAGRVELVEEIIDVGHEIAAAALKAGAMARKRGVDLSVDSSGNLPLLVADRRAVHQMIEHLLSNALKFTPAQGSVMVSAALTPDGGIGVMVADTGAGIAEDDLERVVQPFGRTEMTNRHYVDGTGLGLSVVKRLIEMHGGRLELDSVVGAGTTAILMFPASRAMRPQPLPLPLRIAGG